MTDAILILLGLAFIGQLVSIIGLQRRVARLEYACNLTRSNNP